MYQWIVVPMRYVWLRELHTNRRIKIMIVSTKHIAFVLLTPYGDTLWHCAYFYQSSRSQSLC